jgi:hypothetical protein
MKRKQREANLSTKTRVIDPSRLAGVRGGDGLGITVGGGAPTSDFMQNQHNEALVAL